MLLHSMVICKLCFAIHFCHYVRLFHWKPFYSLPYPFLNPSPYTHMGWHQQEDYISKQEQTKKTDTNLRSFELSNCLNSKQDIFDVIIHVQHRATATSCHMYAISMHCNSSLFSSGISFDSHMSLHCFVLSTKPISSHELTCS